MNANADLAKLATGLILSIIPGFQISSAVSNFSVLYKDWGMPLSATAQFLLSAYPVFYALPIFVVVAWFMPTSRSRRGNAALGTGISIFLLGLLFGAALWWPVMSLQSATSP